MTKFVSKKQFPMFKAADIILAIILIIAGFSLSFFLTAGKSDGASLTVRVDGELYGTYSMGNNQTVDVVQKNDGKEHINRFQIKDGTVTMIKADCHGQDCVQHRSISKTGETIVCLPNKVVLEVTGGDQEYDTISK